MAELKSGLPCCWRGKKRPEHSRYMFDYWTPERRAQKAQAQRQYAAENPDYRKKIASPGEKNPRWRGGISGLKYAPGFGRLLKRQIRERDNFICQLCGRTEAELGYALSIHHSDYDKTNHHPGNLFSTCKRCNSLVNTNRGHWFHYFIALRQFGEDIRHIFGGQIFFQREGLILPTVAGVA